MNLPSSWYLADVAKEMGGVGGKQRLENLRLQVEAAFHLQSSKVRTEANVETNLLGNPPGHAF